MSTSSATDKVLRTPASPTCTSDNPTQPNKTDDDKANWCINGGNRHDWKRWHNYTPVKKYRCERAGQVDGVVTVGIVVRFVRVLGLSVI